MFPCEKTRLRPFRFRLLPVSLLVACCLVLAASAQEPMLHGENRSLVFRSDPDRTFAVDLVDRDGERALRLRVQHSHLTLCVGYLYISHNRISYDPVETPNFRKDAFALTRGEIKKAAISKFAITGDPAIGVWTDKKNYFFIALFDSGTGNKVSVHQTIQDRVHADAVYEFIGRSLNDFDSTLHDAETLTASLGRTEQPAESASSVSSAELREGQTPEEVEAALGKPEDVIKLKQNLVYTYPTVKVFFENGKLVNVEERKK